MQQKSGSTATIRSLFRKVDQCKNKALENEKFLNDVSSGVHIVAGVSAFVVAPLLLFLDRPDLLWIPALGFVGATIANCVTAPINDRNDLVSTQIEDLEWELILFNDKKLTKVFGKEEINSENKFKNR
ncbi:MAG: hypothetical protein SFW66_00270 [Gammaproteobacteria bacterium]|nr:hypothetical protein [Gammaproteobacteria bacterium]